MSTLWFIVPVHGRAALTAICLRQLRRTCDALTAEGIEATAVVVGEDANLKTARKLNFATVRRDNRFTSRKFNDGIQLATDPRFNPRPADYVVPCGSDDWVDHRIFLELPDSNTVLGFQQMSFVREDGRELTRSNVSYTGGCGIRVYPRRLMVKIGYRPADEDRVRACDTSILTNVQKANNRHMRVEHADTDPLQIVDWKSRDQQINSYEDVARWRLCEAADPFEVLQGVFPDKALREMEAHYAKTWERELVSA